ncbi:hypothetical protein MMC07_000053 [Pseudocyphellaria aurata]|nr:hypothetical protein [Pseudocyphellaria aurata]
MPTTQPLRATAGAVVRWSPHDIASPNFVPPFISESGQPDREQPDPSDQDDAVTTTEESDSDNQFPDTPRLVGSRSRHTTTTPAPRRQSKLSAPSVMQPRSQPSRDAPTTVYTQKHAPRSRPSKKRSRHIDISSDTEDERSIRRAKKSITVADAMIAVARSKDRRDRLQFELEQKRFEMEQKQRDKHHEALMLQGRERIRLLRLQIQLSKSRKARGVDDIIMS